MSNVTSMNFRDPNDAKQYKLDLIAVMTILMSAIVMHPKYNTLVEKEDPQEYIELIRDEFRQINTYIVGRCVAAQILHPTLRYGDGNIHLMIIHFAMAYGTVMFEQHTLPNYTDAIRMFDESMKKYF